jgi:hypothetical protein
MKLSDFMRDIADLIDQKMGQGGTDEIGRSLGSEGGDVMRSKTMQRMEPVPQPEANTNNDDTVMVPPLQAKLEILKKSEGIPNVYDKGSDAELAAIKKNAGLTTAQKEASEDNDITG